MTRRESGYTLVEILMALSIAGIFATSMVLVFTKLIGATLVTRQRTVATNLAQERMESLKDLSYHRVIVTPGAALIDPYDASNPNPPETIAAQGVTFTRFTTVQKARESGTALTLLSPSAGDEGLKHIMVEAQWTEDGQTRSVRFSSLVENPNRTPLDSQIHGTVTDTGGSPVENVRVYVLSNPNWEYYTASTGKYTLRVANGDYQVTAVKPAYVTQTSGTLSCVDTTLTSNFTSYTLKQTGTAWGYVFQRENLVISEVCAKLLDDDDNEYVELYNPTNGAITVNNSTIILRYVSSSNVIHGLPLTFLNTSVASYGYFLFANTSTLIVGGTTLAADAWWTNGKKLNAEKGGVILYDSGLNVIDKVGWGLPPFNPAPGQAVEGAMGAMLVTSTELTMCIERRPDFGALPPNGDGNALDTQENSIDFFNHAAWNPQTTTSGTETPTGGTVVLNAYVWVDDGLSSVVLSSSFGYYRDPGIAAGTWTVTASSTLMAREEGALVITNNAVVRKDIVLTGATVYGYITGQVTTGMFGPLNNILLAASGTQTRTSASGQYRLALPVGTHGVIANYNNDNNSYTSETKGLYSLTAGQARTGVDFDLSAGGSVLGTVTTNGVDPLPNIRVQAIDASGNEQGSDLSDVSGDYTISNLPTTGNAYTIQPVLDPKDTSEPASIAATVVSGSTISGFDLTITSGLGTIEGSVTLASGKVIITGVLIIATTTTIGGDPPSITSAVRAGADIYYAVTSDSEGAYELGVRGSASGTAYNVYAWYTDANGSTTKKSGTASVTSSGTVTVDFTAF